MPTKTLYPEIKTAKIAASGLKNGMTTIEPTVDATTGVKSLAYKDEDGKTRKVLTTDSVNTTLNGHSGFFVSAIGDSNMIAEFTENPWTFEFSELSGYNVKNFAIGGDTTQEMIDTQLALAVNFSAKDCYVMGGTNDKGLASSVTIANLDFIYRILQSHGIRVTAIGVLPGDSGTYKTERDEINAWIENTSTANYFVDVTVFDDGAGAIKPEYEYNTDHLNGVGQELLGELVHAVNPIVTDIDNLKRVNDPSDICDVSSVPVDPNAWTLLADVTATIGATAPDGTATAYTIVAGVLDQAHYIKHNVSASPVPAGVRYDGAWAEGGLSPYFRMFNNEATSLAAMVFNMSTGATFNVEDTVDDYGVIPGTGQADGWFFCWMKSSSDVPDDKILMNFYRDAIGSTYASDGVTPEGYIWNPFKCDTLKEVYELFKAGCGISDDAKLVNAATGVLEVPQMSSFTTATYHKYISKIQDDPTGQILEVHFDDTGGLINGSDLFVVSKITDDYTRAGTGADIYTSPMFTTSSLCKWRQNESDSQIELGLNGFNFIDGWVRFIE